ncbi:MAG: DUF6273 domain-containing protein [Eubacteriales bacterium]|nr:DUF6273 domain-containing protein [Eubacteriales bacterium]
MCFYSNDEKRIDLTWRNCTLRKWLNNEFYNKAFSNDEKNRIIETIHKNESNRGAIHPDTNDKVFLLSEKEIKKYFENENNYDSDMGMYDEKKENDIKQALFNATTKMTDYVDRNRRLLCIMWDSREHYYILDNRGGKGFIYWLRTPSSNLDDDCTPILFLDNWLGTISEAPGFINFIGVRPAIWVSLE